MGQVSAAGPSGPGGGHLSRAQEPTGAAKYSLKDKELLLEEKMKNYYREIKSVKEMVKGDVIKHVENDSDIWASIVREINLKTREEAAGESANP